MSVLQITEAGRKRVESPEYYRQMWEQWRPFMEERADYSRKQMVEFLSAELSLEVLVAITEAPESPRFKWGDVETHFDEIGSHVEKLIKYLLTRYSAPVLV